MPPRHRAIAVVVLLLLAVGAWLWVAAPSSPPLPAAPTASDAAGPSSPPAAVAASTPAPPPVAERVAAPAVPAPPPAPGPLATIRGRCVDGRGAPLAGCRVTVSGWEANRGRMEEWLRDHGKPEWRAPDPVTTAADGVFAVAFWPPPPFQFAIEVRHDARALVSARWSEIAAGALVDVGDVAMQPGIRVQGRVVDDAGRGVDDLLVRVDSTAPGANGDSPRPSPRRFNYARSEADGRFVVADLLPAGPFHARAEDPRGVSPPVVGTLAPERPVEEVTLVVARTQKGPTITGRVVDAAGRPIRNATVRAMRDEHTPVAGDMSRKDGGFELVLPGGEASQPVLLEASHDEHEPGKTAAAVAWGAADVVLTLVDAGGLAVYVHDEAQRLVTDFRVRVAPRGSRAKSSEDYRIRASGPFAAGFADVKGVGRGAWTVVVEFASAAARAPVFVPIDKADQGVLRVDVRAPQDVARTLRLVDGGGRPVAGSAVQLLLLPGGAWQDWTMALPRDRFFGLGAGDHALVLQGVTTDAAGAATLVGPPGVGLVVTATGSGHVPVRALDVRLDVDGDLVLTATTGARLHGRVGPAAVFAEMQRLAGDPAASRPTLQLVAEGRSPRVVQPARRDDARFAIAADGQFDIAGLTPGAWQVCLQYGVRQGPMTMWKSMPLATVALVEGEALARDFDASGLLPGTLRGVVRKNGVPLADAILNLQGTLSGAAGGAPAMEWANATTDADGRFEATLRPGVYRVTVSAQLAPGFHGAIDSAETALVVVGQTVEQAFTIATGTLQATVRTADGAVAAGVGVQARRVGSEAWRNLPPTDANGRIDVEFAAEALQFRVLQKRLQSETAKQQLLDALRAGGGAPNGDPFAAAWIDAGGAAVVAGQTTVVELVLPAAWAAGATDGPASGGAPR
jgi:protocatechuate 3,4-dioxygenase beta subunit